MRYIRNFCGLICFVNYFILCSAANCPSYTASSGILFEIVVNDVYVLNACSNNETFSSGDLVLESECINGFWAPLTSTSCPTTSSASGSGSTTPSSCTSPPLAPIKSTKVNITNGNFSAFTTLFKCSNGTSWLSGQYFRLSQCIGGNWSTIYDICVPDSDLPRQCADVMALGIKKDGQYNIMPLGRNGPTFTATCQINVTNINNNGGGWTVILYKTSGVVIAPDFPILNSYETGIFKNALNYWAGLKLLSLLSLDKNGNQHGMILEVSLVDSSNNFWHATYGNFSIAGSPLYTLISIGTYHGNAGDSMCSLVGTKFYLPSSVGNTWASPCWWGTASSNMGSLESIDGNYLTSSQAFWGTLPKSNGNQATLKTIQMRVRPINYDQAIQCPPMVGSLPSWTKTASNISYFRSPGSNITWQCMDEYLYEGDEGENRTTSGDVKCLNDTIGKLPYWSRNVTLPCSLVCPTNFQVNYNATTCFHASVNASKDFVSAQLQCEALNATLATVTNTLDAAIGDGNNARYFMSYTDRPASSSTRPSFVPTLPPIGPYAIKCSGQCSNNGTNQKVDPTLECTTLSNSGTYEFVSCATKSQFMCELPVRCSAYNQGAFRFFEVKGHGCYTIIQNGVNIKDVYEKCRKLGAGLAYPTSVAMMQLLTNATITFLGTGSQIFQQTGLVFGLGLTYIKENWSHGYYLVEEDLYNKPAKDPVSIWQTVTMYGSDRNWGDFVAVNLSSNVAYGICHYNGQLDCHDDPPAIQVGITSNWSNSYAYSTVIKYSCTLGYFPNGNTTLPIHQSVTCLGQIGEWYSPTPFQPCLPVPVCTNQTLQIPPEVTMHEDQSSYFYLGQLQFRCPNGTSTTSGDTTQKLICNLTAASTDILPVFSFMPGLVNNCSNCIGAVSVENATSTWDTSSSYKKNDTLLVTCNNNYQFAFNVTMQNVTCKDLGWNYTYTSGCYLACTNEPPPPMSNMSMSPLTVNNIGTSLQYTCDAGLKFAITMNFKNITNTVNVTCQNGTWINPRDTESFACVPLCEVDPPAPPGNATYNWDGYSRGVTVAVTYTCPDLYLWPDYLSNLTITCNGSHWIGIGNTSFACKQACNAPPVEYLNATTNSTSVAFVNEIANYTCLVGLGNQTNKATNFSISCTNTSKWSNKTNFLCENVCLIDPILPPRYAKYDYKNYTKNGTLVTYSCPFGSFENQTGSQLKLLQSTCYNGNWTLETIPDCLTITTPGPTTVPPIILPEVNQSLTYPSTSTIYYGDMAQFNSTSGVPSAVNSLIGFGSAISLNKNMSQCMHKSPYTTNQSCLTNPSTCTTGLSFSLWTLVLYDNSVYDMTGLSDADNQYFMSTGADTAGHPGVAIGVAKQWLFALVSTGSQYWYTRILGQISNNTWNNVGVRWSPTLGMEVYVNASKVGSTTVINTATAQPTYAIPTLLIGCQKTASDSNYSGYFNGYVDELAMWNKVVPLTSNLSLYFLGGYSENTSNISPAEFASMLTNIQINNPGQQAAAVKILTQLTATSAVTTVAPPVAQTNSVTLSNASPTDASSTADTFTTPPPANVKGLKTIGNILMQMMDPTRLPTSVTPEQASSFLKLSESFSNIIGPDNTANWQIIQNQTESVGIMQLIQQFKVWHSKLMQAITYTNESKPLCNDIANTNLYIKYCKMTICDFGILEKRYQVPDYSQQIMQQIRDMWKDTVTDRIAFPTQIFPDSRCCDRPVSFIFHYYGFAERSAVSLANPMYVSSSEFRSIDSRIMNLDIVSDLGYDSLGNIDTSQPLCSFDTEAMVDQQLFFKASHMDKNEAQIVPRKLLLFENETVTDIHERLCVYWNENLTDYGAWDSAHCGMVKDTGEYSKCACSNVGIFAIMAVKNEPIEVPDEPQWIFLLKYIFYGLSVFAVIVYITVVMMSGELKDQFHLVGLHLAIAILIGSIAMVVSDFSSVKDDRNTCTIVGTVIHIFYGAVGMWILSLGHASFNAITSGVIGGRLLSYTTISWGFPLAFAGIPFITMLSLMGYDPRCFIGWDNIVKWVFFAPQMACALIASFFAIVILCNLSTPALRKENLIKDYGTFCRGAALLILYLSITWAFGLVTYMRLGITITNFYPIFQVLNSLSGVCLLVLIGFGSERFRSTLTGQTKARREILRQYAFGLPNTADMKGSKNMESNSPSTASTSSLIPEVHQVPT